MKTIIFNGQELEDIESCIAWVKENSKEYKFLVNPYTRRDNVYGIEFEPLDESSLSWIKLKYEI